MKPVQFALFIGCALVLTGCQSYRGGPAEEQKYDTGYDITRTPRTTPGNPNPEPEVYPNSSPPVVTPP